MALYVIDVPDPAAGADWRATVPGQYVYDITGITATLDTAIQPGISLDSSGNGLDLTVNAPRDDTTWGANGPYAGGAGDYGVSGVQSGNAQGVIQTATSALFDTLNTTAEFWVWLDGGPDFLNSVCLVCNNTAGNIRWGFGFPAVSDDPARVTEYQGGVGVTIALGFLPRAGWHHVAFTADGVNWRGYLDGVLKFTFAGRQPIAAAAPFVSVFRPAITSNVVRGRMAAAAVYPVALSGAQIAAHAGAGGSNANYKAAALADAPTGLWMLDTLPTITSRTVTLEITDGTNVVASYPAPFPTGSVSGVLTFSWQPAGTSSAQTPSGLTTTVAIPRLVLPAGYTIGTRTLDLVGSDQWSDIKLWWSSGVMDSGGAFAPWAYPPGVFLHYEQETQP